ncbi:14217_t:CDS:2, partial [Ambispora leptoticha]
VQINHNSPVVQGVVQGANQINLMLQSAREIANNYLLPEFQLPTIVIIGETGVGKSTLGNMVLGLGPENEKFRTSDSGDSVTQYCEFAPVTIDDSQYILLDTPGFIDSAMPDSKTWKKLGAVINKCAYGVKAVLLVMAAGRYTQSHQIVVESAINFLGYQSLDHIIVVFTKCSKKQIQDPQVLLDGLSKKQKELLERVHDRWIIVPNPDYFDADSPETVENLTKLKKHINSINDIYTKSIFQSVKDAQQQRLLQLQGEIEASFQAYDQERLVDGDDLAKERFQERMAKIRAEMDETGITRAAQLAKSNGCFSLDTMVTLENGKSLSLNEVKVGERILSHTKDGRLEYSEVYMIAHYNADEPTEFLQIAFSNGVNKGKLNLTPTHHIRMADGSFQYANRIHPEKSNLLSIIENKLVPTEIVSIEHVIKRGYICVFTHSGTIIADGIQCSCYSNCIPYQNIIHLVLSPLRLYSKVGRIQGDGQAMHPYLKILKTMYDFGRMKIRG